MQEDKTFRPCEPSRANCVCPALFTGFSLWSDCGLAGSLAPLAHFPIAVERLS